MRGEIEFEQPVAPEGAVSDPDRLCWVLLDGLFHNRKELISNLREESWIDSESSDEELLMAGYLRWGESVVAKLAGDFAFVLWDKKARCLLAATDPFGCRSLNYVDQPHRFAFGSRTSDLWRLPWIDDELDQAAVVAYLIDQEPEPEQTFYSQIRRLPAGLIFRKSAESLEVRRYWGPHFSHPKGVRTREDLLETFRELFVQVVAERLETEDPVTILMSGGFDSTAVAGVAGALWRQGSIDMPPIRIFSNVFEGMPCDETRRIEQCLETLPFPAELVSPLGWGISADAIDQDARLHDGPLFNLQRPSFEYLYEAARARGTKVVLSGLGGDELATDFDYQIDFLRSSGMQGATRAIRRLAAIEEMSMGRVVKWLAAGALPAWATRSYRRVRHGRDALPEAWAESWLTPEMRRVARRVRAIRLPETVGFDSRSSEIRWQIINSHQVQTATGWWTREFQAHDLRVSSPFQDRRLFELLLGVPSAIHPRSFPTGDYKPLISRGLREFIPSNLTVGFWKVTLDCYNQHVLDLSFDALRGYLFREEWRAGHFISRARVLELLESYEKLRSEDPQDVFKIYRLVQAFERIAGLEAWLRTRRTLHEEPHSRPGFSQHRKAPPNGQETLRSAGSDPVGQFV